MHIIYHDGIAICRAGQSARILVGHFVRGADGSDSVIELHLQNLDHAKRIMDSLNVRMSTIEARELASRILARCLGSQLNNDALVYMENELCKAAKKIVNSELPNHQK